MRPNIIAFCGPKRCGKDVCARFVSDTYGYGHVKFASGVKEMVQVLFGFTEDQCEGPEKDTVDSTWGIRPRDAMQFMGTEVMQFKIQDLLPNVGRLFWANQLFARHGTHNLVISDLRFVHEAKMIKTVSSSSLIIRIHNPSVEAFHGDAHMSEHEHKSIPCDATLINDGDIRHLHNQLRVLLQEHQ